MGEGTSNSYQFIMKLIILLLAAAIGASTALDCVQIPDSSIHAGHSVSIPTGATQPVDLPPNYNCTYQIKSPSMVYAHVRLENQLKGGNDMITVRDAMGKRILVSSRYGGNLNFYVFPGTTTTFQVVTRSVGVGSKFRMFVRYVKMPNPTISQIGSDLKYFYLNDLQTYGVKPPQNVVSNQQVVLTTAPSQASYDDFFNYFIIDGTLSTNKGVYHLSDYLHRNFVSSANNLTVVGLDNLVSASTIILSNIADTRQFFDFTAVTADTSVHTVTVNGVDKREGMTVIAAKNSNTVTFTGFKLLDNSRDPQCSVKAYSSPMTENSPVLLDFTTVNSFPYTVNQKYFIVVVQSCSAQFTFYSQ